MAEAFSAPSVGRGDHDARALGVVEDGVDVDGGHHGNGPPQDQAQKQ